LEGGLPINILYSQRNFAPEPSGVITTVTHPNAAIVTDGTGLFWTDVYLDEPGEWRVCWEGRNTNRAAEEVSIIAEKGEFYTLSGAEKPDS
jgi:hypothetical protein